MPAQPIVQPTSGRHRIISAAIDENRTGHSTGWVSENPRNLLQDQSNHHASFSYCQFEAVLTEYGADVEVSSLALAGSTMAHEMGRLVIIRLSCRSLNCLRDASEWVHARGVRN